MADRESEQRGISTLRSTFIHIPGVGYSTERHLWDEGVQTWEDFPEKRDSLGLRSDILKAIDSGLEISEDSLRRHDHRYFAISLPTREYWRAYPDFKHDTAFLDIETTGLDPDNSAVTVVGLHDRQGTRSFVKGDNLDEFPAALRRYRQIVSFNGARFDLPYLKQTFPGLTFDQIHIDLRYPLRRLGFVGGLKAIERRLGVGRSEETRDLTGFDAVRLWRAHEQGDSHALEILLEYNAEDVRNLETLVDFSYCTLKTAYMRRAFPPSEDWREMAGTRVP